MTRKKLVIIGIAVISVLGIFLFFFLRKGEGEKLIKEPIVQKSLPVSRESISVDIREVSEPNTNYPLYQITKGVKLERITKLASENGFRLVDSETEGYYFWKRGEEIISYNEVSNIFTVEAKNVLHVPRDIEYGVETFSYVAGEYFNEKWVYDLVDQKEFSDSIQEYFVSRKLEDGLNVKMREGLNETDYLQIQDGKIVYARLMLSNFVKTDSLVPLLSKNKLKQYLAQKEYPKEIFPEPSILLSELDVDPYSQEYIKATEVLTDCVSDEVNVVYYYKSMNQDLLTPIYKISARCDANYEGQKYQIPVTILTNAIEPNYILLDEKE